MGDCHHFSWRGMIFLSSSRTQIFPIQTMDSESECVVGERDIRDMEIDVAGNSDNTALVEVELVSFGVR